MDLQLLTEQLIICSKDMRPSWGEMQNHSMDWVGERIGFWKIETFDVLREKLSSYNGIIHRRYTPEEIQYTTYRWYINGCSKCDEYAFYSKPNVINNPNHQDKDWDIEFHNNPKLRRDLKNTIIPKQFRGREEYFYEHPEELIIWMYDNQSKGARLSYNDRLIVIHVSDNATALRGRYDCKDKIFSEYIDLLKDPNYKQITVEVFNTLTSEMCTVTSDIIFIIEDKDGNITHKFASSKLN